MCVKTTPPVTRLTETRNTGNSTSVGERVEEAECSYVADGVVKGDSHFGASVAVLQQVIHGVAIHPRNSTPRFIPGRKENRHLHKNLSTHVDSSIIHCNRKAETSQMFIWWTGKPNAAHHTIAGRYVPADRNEVLTRYWYDVGGPWNNVQILQACLFTSWFVGSPYNFGRQLLGSIL